MISADSRQFYKELSIGTAKPTKQEQGGIPHYFIDSHQLTEEVTAAQFESEALKLLEALFEKNDIIVLTGGSGMFIDALCIGLDPIPANKSLREKITLEFEKNGLSPLLIELEEKDPEYFSVVDKENPVRIIRAIEVLRLTGKKFSSQRNNNSGNRFFNCHRYVLNHERERLYQRINRRVDEMMSLGLLEEVKTVRHLSHLSSLNTVGYKELFDFLDNKSTLEEAVEKIKMNTRRYAKRQLTWFRRHEEAKWIDYNSFDQVLSEIIEDIKRKVTD